MVQLGVVFPGAIVPGNWEGLDLLRVGYMIINRGMAILLTRIRLLQTVDNSVRGC